MDTYPERIGPYRLLREIGRSSLYVDFRAEDTRSGQELILKLPGELFPQRSARLTQFVSAGQRAARLEHPNIVAVHSAGEADGYYYIASDYVEGERLTDLLADRETSLDPEHALTIVSGIMLALDYAHDAGIVHDGLTTDNVIVADNGHVLVADFCLAEGVDVAISREEASPPAFETLFLAPEQLRADVENGLQADVFGLGVVTYAMMARRLPFEAETQGALRHAIVNDPPFPPQSANPQIPPGIAYVLSNALVKEPDVRYGGAGEFYDALVAGLAWKSPVVDAAALATEQAGGRRRGAMLAVLIGLIAIVAASVLLLRPNDGLFDNGLADGEQRADVTDVAATQAPPALASTVLADANESPTAAEVAAAETPSDSTADDLTDTPASTPPNTPTSTATPAETPTAADQSDAGAVIAAGSSGAAATIISDTISLSGTVSPADGNSADSNGVGDAGEESESSVLDSNVDGLTSDSSSVEGSSDDVLQLPTLTSTPSPVATATNTPRPTATNTSPPTATATSTPSNTSSPTATSTSTPESTASSTNTQRPTATSTNTPRPTATSTNTPRPAATSTNTPRPTATSTNTPRPTATSTNTPRPAATSTNTPRPTATSTNTPRPAATSTNTPRPTATSTNTPRPTATSTNTPRPTATATNSPEPTATSTNTPLPLPTSTSTSTPTVTPIPVGAAAVQLVQPVDGSANNGSLNFQWVTSVTPGEGQAFELVFWRPDQTPIANGFGLSAPTVGSQVSVDLSALDSALGDLLEPGDYLWGLLLVQTDPYQRVQFLGAQNNFRFYREGGSSSSGGPPSSGE